VEDAYLTDVPLEWPEWRLEWRATPADQRQAQRVSPDAALLDLLPEGQVLVERSTRTATFLLPERPPTEAWAHPHLSTTAVIASSWLGRRSFHAGAFIAGAGAWGVLGEKGDGKTSMMAWLVKSGYPIVCDDTLVVDKDQAMAGPRCIDLRHGAADYFQLGTYIGHIGTRERWRAQVAAVPPTAPFRGWVVPTWGDDVRVGPVPAAQRLPLLVARRGFRVPEADDGKWLDLLALPMVSFQRPQDWSAMDVGMTHLLDQLADL
jgi:hypothetical protein